MRPAKFVLRLFPMIALATCVYAGKSQIEMAGVACQTPPPMHCPDANCAADMIAQTGSAVEPKTGRNFFLDYPCNLKPGEKVTFILSLHGAGSIGNWHRHYFPLIDYKDKYRLIVATPTSSIVPNSNPPTHVWNADADDAYLQNIVNLVLEQAKEKNIKIKTFWLVGHSQGGLTSNRLIRTDFFKDKADGFLSLSGGRIGGSPGRGDFGRGPSTTAGAGRGLAGRGPATPQGLPANDFSFIFETGQHEMDSKGLPEKSEWAEKEGCGARVRRADVVDAKAGYVSDTRPQTNPSDAWGRKPRPGTADVFEYPHCNGGRVVVDVVRESKGHTEGLEPHVTEQLIKLMLSAKLKKSEVGD